MNYFILRRFFSLAPIFSLGLFLTGYFYLYSKPLGPGGREAFDLTLQSYRSFPFSAVLVWGFVFIPLIPTFFYLITSISAPSPPWRIWFYRPVGVLGILFLGYHFFINRIFENMANGLIDFIGIGCLVFYFTQSVWHALIGWGVTVSPHSRKGALYACWVLFIFFMGINGLIVVNDMFREVAPAWIAELLNFVRDYLFL